MDEASMSVRWILPFLGASSMYGLELWLKINNLSSNRPASNEQRTPPTPTTTSHEPFPSSLLSTPLIELRLGGGSTTPSPTSFYIHSGLLTSESTFFAAALRTDTPISTPTVITLPTEDPAVFQHVATWLYTRSFVDSEPESPTIATQISVWAFADRRGMVKLMNAMVDSVREKLGRVWVLPDAEELELVVQVAGEGRGLRRFVMEVVGCIARERMIKENEEVMRGWGEEILRDVLMASWEMDGKEKKKKRWSRRMVREMEMCGFHEHVEGEACG